MKNKLNYIILVIGVMLSFVISSIIIMNSLGLFNRKINHTVKIQTNISVEEKRVPYKFGKLSWLKVNKNKITNNFNNNIIFKGLMMKDLYFLKGDEKLTYSFFSDIRKKGANIVRIPIHPDLWLRDSKYLEECLVPAIKYMNALEMYAIIDLHFIGNIVEQDKLLTPKIKDNPLSMAKKFWAQVARKFKNNPGVIFELCNEPANISENKWHKCAEELVDIIRNQAAKQLIIVGGVNYSQRLSVFENNPILDENIAYAAHIYPAHDSSNWENWFGDFSLKKPVIVTEWGFIDENRKSTKQTYLIGDSKNYGIPFLNYLDKKNIGWVACWYDDTWEPQMYKTDGKGLTNYGKFVFSNLNK